MSLIDFQKSVGTLEVTSLDVYPSLDKCIDCAVIWAFINIYFTYIILYFFFFFFFIQFLSYMQYLGFLSPVFRLCQTRAIPFARQLINMNSNMNMKRWQLQSKLGLRNSPRWNRIEVQQRVLCSLYPLGVKCPGLSSITTGMKMYTVEQ